MTFENEEGYTRAVEFYSLIEGDSKLEILGKWFGVYELEI